MDFSAWSSAVVVALIGAVGVVAQDRRRPGARDLLKSDIEIYGSLPDGSTAREALLQNIDRQIDALISLETNTSRDPSGISIALVLLGGGTYTTAVVAQAGGAWRFFWIGTLFMVIVGLVGLAESVPKKLRDSRGDKIK